MVDSLTVDTVPIIQSSRLEDYSPELWALTGAKGATVLSMLRNMVGDEKFFEILKTYAQEDGWKSSNTDDFQKVAENVSKKESGIFLHGVDRIERRAAIQAGVHGVSRTAEGFSRDGQDHAGPGHVPHAGGIEDQTEGNPEQAKVDVVGTSSEFSVDTFGKPKTVTIDPNEQVLHYEPDMRVAVAIRKGEQFVELSEFGMR